MKCTSKQYKGTLYRRGKIWWIEYYVKDPSGKRQRVRRSLKTPVREEAEARAGKLTEAFLPGWVEGVQQEAMGERDASLVDRSGGKTRNRIRLADAWGRFPYDKRVRGGSRAPLNPRTIVENERMWSTFLEYMEEYQPQKVCMDEVTHQDATRYSRYCINGLRLGARAHNVRIGVCRVMYNLAGMEGGNPFKGVKRRQEHTEHRGAFEMEEVEKLLVTATGEMRLLVLIGIYTGLRMGDAAHLRWSEIRGGRIFKTMARPGREVSIAIHPVLQEALPERPADGGYVMPELADIYDRAAGGVSMLFRKLAEDCGLTVTEEKEGRRRAVSRLGYHALHTTFIAICARGGVPVGAIAEWCGQSEEVNRIYRECGDRGTDEAIIRALSGTRMGGVKKKLAHKLSKVTNNWRSARKAIELLANKVDPDEMERIIEALQKFEAEKKHEHRGWDA